MPVTNLENFIKLSIPFVNEYYKGVVGIIVLENLIFQDLENHLKQFKLTYPQFNILRILKGQYPNAVELSTIKERLIYKHSDVSRLIDRLVRLQWIEKKTIENNKRKLTISLSELGYELINSIDISHDGFKSLASNLSFEEMQQFNFLVDKILEKKA